MTENRITRQSVIKASDSQVSCRLGEETVVLQIDSGRYLGMDSVATIIWEFIQNGPRSFSEIRNHILEEYEVSVEECEADLFDMLGQLLTNGLIEVEDGVTN